jgi:Rho-related BTB domain-containing protein 1/2
MCFDIGRAGSLENCKEMWYAQIKRFCPNTPVILVGCKNDVRYIYKDEQYLKFCRDRSPLVRYSQLEISNINSTKLSACRNRFKVTFICVCRQVREADLVMPEYARSVAKELGIPYYETSVFTYFGIDEVFENAIRAALCTRRQQRFWMTNLKRVMGPTLQEPFCPPRPKLTTATTLDSSYLTDLTRMARQQNYTDLIFLCGSVGFSAHRFMMASASPLLRRILTTDYSQDLQTATRSNSETSLVSAIIICLKPNFSMP